MEARILGPLRITVNGRPVAVGTAHKPRLMLAALLAYAGRPLSVDTLTAALWDAEPPASARRNIQLYAHRLRHALGADAIVAGDRGYVFAAVDAVDAVHFRRLADRGRRAERYGDLADAARIGQEALALWRGSALTEFDDCRLVADEARRLEELRLDIHELWARSELAAGDPTRVAAEAAALVRAHPFRESLCGLLMRALYRSGRQAESLAAYRHARRHLVEQLGIEPGPDLQRLHAAILRGDDSLLDGVDCLR